MKWVRVFIVAILLLQCGSAFGAESLTGEAYRLADQAYKAMNAGDIDTADKAIREALVLKPDSGQLLGMLDQVKLMRHGKAHKLAGEAYKAVDAGKIDKAYSLSYKAIKLHPDNPQLLALVSQVLILNNKDKAAARALDRALVLRPGFARVLAMRGFLRLSQGNEDGAKADFHQALEKGELSQEEEGNVAMGLADLYSKDGHYQEAVRVLEPFVEKGNDRVVSKWQANVIMSGGLPEVSTHVKSQEVKYALLTRAYKELREKKDERSLELFLAAERIGGLTPVQYGDAGYAARRSIENKQAIRLFMAAIDAVLDEPFEKKTLTPREIFGLRRAIDELKRQWGFVYSSSLSDGGGTSGGGTGSSGIVSGNVSPTVSGPSAFIQTSVEFYYQPPVIGYRDGRKVQIFVSSYLTRNDGNGGPVGSETIQGSVGARWKPFRDHNLVLTAERLFKIGRFAFNDWLLRVGYSLDHGVDIQPYLDDWTYRTLFVETAYLVNQERSINNLEARWGHVFRFSKPRYLTFIPHALFSMDFDSASLQRLNAGVGFGGSLRWWFRETKYRAPSSYIDLTVQYKFGLVEDATRQDGVFGRLNLWY